MISPPPASAHVGVAAAVSLPAAFQRADPARVALMAMVIPDATAADQVAALGPALPVPIGAVRRPASPAQSLFAGSSIEPPFQPGSFPASGVTDASAGAALAYTGLDNEPPVSTYLRNAPGVTGLASGIPPSNLSTAAPSAGTAAPVVSRADAPVVLADSAQPVGTPAGAPPVPAPAQASAPAAPPASPPITNVQVGQVAACYLLYCGTAAQTSDNSGNYNYLLGAGVNLSGKPVTGSITYGQQDLWAPNMSTTAGAGLLGTYSWSSGPLSLRVTGQMEFPIEQIPTAIAYSAGPLGQLAMWAFPDYFPPLSPTISAGGSLTVKGSAVLSFFPTLAPILPSSVTQYLDKLQYSKGGFYSYNSDTGEWTYRSVDSGKLQIAGSDGYLVGFVKIPSQTSLTDLAKQAGDRIFGSNTPQPSPADPQPSPADSQPSPADSQPSPADPQPSPADSQPSPADSQPSAADPQPGAADPQPSAADANLPSPIGSQSSTDGGQRSLATGSDAAADPAYGQANADSVTQPSPIGAGLGSTDMNAGTTATANSPASAANSTIGAGSVDSTSLGSTAASNTWAGTTSSSGGTSSYGSPGASTSTSTATTSLGGASYAGTSGGGTSAGGASYGGTSGGGTSAGGTTSTTTSSGGSTSSG